MAKAAAKGPAGVWEHRSLLMVPALLPGVLMTPLSSVLEACNADHMNKEPLYRRWLRGIVPRTAREIIFGLGLNNLTDFMEERVPCVCCAAAAAVATTTTIRAYTYYYHY